MRKMGGMTDEKNGKGGARAAQDKELLPRTVRAAEVPGKGLRMAITLSGEEKAALCAFYGLQAIGEFEARLMLERKTASEFRLSGRLNADVLQSCVVSFEPVKTLIDEDIALTLVPESEFERYREGKDEEGSLILELDEEVPDTYRRDAIDLGRLVLEYFSLGLQPYPRAQDAHFERDMSGDEKPESPFAGLIVLKDKIKPR